MKLPELKGYNDSEKESVDSNPSTINNILGVGQPSFKGLSPLNKSEDCGKPDNGMLLETVNSAPEVKESMPDTSSKSVDDEMRKKDIHINRGTATDDADISKAKELRIEDAYSFLNAEIEDSFSEEDLEGSSDEFAAGDAVLKPIRYLRYGTSNILGAMGATKRGYANKVDREKRTDKIIKAAANIGSKKTGIDSGALSAVGHIANDAGKYGVDKSKELYKKWKNK